MENNKFNEKDSLELITRMIQNTQNRIAEKPGQHFMFWGYLTIVVTIAVWCTLIFTNDAQWNLLWLAIPVIGWPANYIMGRNAKKTQLVTTYIDKIINYVWTIFGLLTWTFMIMLMMNSFENVLFVVLQLISASVILTGLIARFKILIVTGSIVMLTSIATIFITDFNYQMFNFILSFVIMMVIPGHILNYRGRNQKNITQC